MSDYNAPPKAKRLKRVEEKPLSDNNVPPIKYEVFVSFRGEDIRRNFLSHLIAAFENKQINAFVDDRLVRGEEVWPSLVEAIEQSDISLIIFSPDYASSRWCLKELVKILKCKEKYGRNVIPVFYNVEPTDLRHPSSGSYKNAFIEHETNHETKVQKWKNALKKAAGLSGSVSSNFRSDAQLVKEIVELVLGRTRLHKSLTDSKGLVGIDEKVAEIELLIRKKPKDVHIIGIWGIGGIGKTILAEQVFNKLKYEYDGYYFLANEREESSKQTLLSLKKEMFSELLGNATKIETPNSLPHYRIRRMKVLIVLDDVMDSDHINKLLGNFDHFGSGSTIIVTTRDKQVLHEAHEIYQLGELSPNEALELFNWIAFKQSEDQMEYYQLSKQVVDYAQGIPLVLRVLAYLLRGKEKEVWESKLGELKKEPNTEVYDVMKLSYTNLNRKQQRVFLDLACFVLRLHGKVNVSNVKSLLKDGTETVVASLDRLKDNGFTTFSKHNTVSMHDKLQEMAWEIVRQESIGNPGRRSRLWDPNDIYEALKNDEITEVIKSIQIRLPTIKPQKLMPHIFAKMNRLEFLEITGTDNYNCYSQLIAAAEGLQFLATELRYLGWYNYPLKTLPTIFSGKKLVILKLERGKMEKLWDGIKNLVNLKELVLNKSKMLKELPDLSKAMNLEILLLSGCSGLTSVHPSIFSLPKLEKLDLSKCTSLSILASDSRLCILNYLNLDWCKNLREFSLIAVNIKELRLIQSDIEKLPSSFNNLTQLLHLHVGHCNKLQTIPELPLILETLDVKFCESLESLPVLPQSLKTLNVSFCELLESLPMLPLFLKTLNVSCCESLQSLPVPPLSLETLQIRYLESLKIVLFHSNAIEQLREATKHVLFWNCLNLSECSLMAIGLNVQINVMKFANQHLFAQNHNQVESYNDYEYNFGSYQAVYGYSGSRIPMWVKNQTRKDNIIIDLSSAPPSPQWGFIFCFVIECFPIKSRNTRLEFNITISDCVGEGRKESFWMYTNSLCDDTVEIDTEWESESDHVCVVYDQRCSDFLNRRAKDQTKFKIQVVGTTRFLTKNAVQQEVLKEFGVCPINTLTYNNFI